MGIGNYRGQRLNNGAVVHMVHLDIILVHVQKSKEVIISSVEVIEQLAFIMLCCVAILLSTRLG